MDADFRLNIAVILLTILALLFSLLTASLLPHRLSAKQLLSQSRLAATITPNPSPYSGWRVYNNQAYGISFQYPPNWQVVDNCNDQSQTISLFGALTITCSINLNSQLTVASLEIINTNLGAATKMYDTYYAQLVAGKTDFIKTQNKLQGRLAVQYVLALHGAVTKQYLFGVGDKTYSFRSVNELTSNQHSATYQTDFNKVFESLRFAQ